MWSGITVGKAPRIRQTVIAPPKKHTTKIKHIRDFFEVSSSKSTTENLDKTSYLV
jgi:hypothetical protein